MSDNKIALIEQIKQDRKQAMRDRKANLKRVLTSLYGELQTDSARDRSEITNDKVVTKCKKVISNNNDTMGRDIPEYDKVQLSIENDILAEYLPAQLTATEIRAIITDISDKSVKTVMPVFSKEYKGRFDGALVKDILKEF